MSQMPEDPLAYRVKELEGKLFQTRWTAAIGIVAAVAALVGHCVSYTNAGRDHEVKQDQLTLNIQQLQSKNLEALEGSYEQSKATVKRIAAIHGIKAAVEFELPFRKGSTIRALEELEANLPAGSEEDRRRIDDTLSAVPYILFVDSQLSENIYCGDSRMISATNVDDIVELVKDLPVRIVGQIGNRVGVNRIVDGVRREKPTLIVMHLGSFAGFSGDGLELLLDDSDVTKTTEFLKRVAGAGFNGNVIVYSRKAGDLAQLRDAYFGSGLNLVTVGLQGDSKKDDDCFALEKVNGRRIVRAVRSAIQYENLYARGPWSNEPIVAQQRR